MWWLYVGIILILIYFWTKRSQNYWTKKGVIQTNPAFLLGDHWDLLIRKRSFLELFSHLYKQFPGHRYSGMYQFLTPTLMIRDPELIKQICVKDFEYFTDHRQIIKGNVDPLWTKNLFSLTGQEWRDMRQTLSPAFTSSKMRAMFVLMRENAQQFVDYFLEKKSTEVIELEMKDTFTRFTNDVIANTAFGIGCDSLKNPENAFYQMGKDVTDFSKFKRRMLIIGFNVIPRIMEFFGFTLFSLDIREFFLNIVKDSIKMREENGIIRPDMINLMIEARKHGLKYEESNDDTGFATVEESELGKKLTGTKRVDLTDMDITAQALIFFFAGFDMVSGVMCFLTHQLAVDPDIQQKLYEEIIETHQKCPDGKLTYELINSIKYLDMTVSETLRKWPLSLGADRICTKPYTIQPVLPHEKPLNLQIGECLLIPFAGLHYDPEYYPDPDKFDPERFNDENKKNIKPYTYIPFGVGPRNCIGSRFALLETKAIIYHLLLNFEIIPTKRTQIPLKLSKKHLNVVAENGFWLGLKRRITQL